MVDSVRRAASGLVEAAATSVTLTAQIHSPSKLFAKLGKYIPMGLAQGIDNGTKYVEESINSLIPSRVESDTGSVKRYANSYSKTNNGNGNNKKGSETTINFYDTPRTPDAIARQVKKITTFGMARSYG